MGLLQFQWFSLRRIFIFVAEGLRSPLRSLLANNLLDRIFEHFDASQPDSGSSNDVIYKDGAEKERQRLG